ncbi:thioredoxin family protein [Halobacillus seohaensis]|uniref:Thioredoxin family protein n=1 Tax=Halobacillus seohaensis TaxID=447421 RepID=A0ABW2ERK3_9BACI
MRVLEEKDVSSELNNAGITLTYIFTPFCGTCHLARKMLDTIEATFQRHLFYELNASLHPELMQDYEVKSVPCLLITENGKIVNKIYAFKSVPYMYEEVTKYVK